MFHPYNYAQNIPLLEFSVRFGIVTEAYSSLTYVQLWLLLLRQISTLIHKSYNQNAWWSC